MKFLALAFILLSQTALATVCAPKNFITEPNSPFQKIPVYDQDGIGICFAYAAAQLLDYHLIKQGAPARSVHPIWAALIHARQVSVESGTAPQNISYGSGRRAMEATTAMNCSYNTVENSLSTWARKAKVSDAELVSFLEAYMTFYSKLYDEKKARSILDNSSIQIDDIDILVLINSAKGHSNLQYCSASATWDALVPELRALSVMNTPDMLAALIMPGCEHNKQPLNLPRAIGAYLGDNDENVLSLISNKIDKLNAPISISYCGTALTNPAYDGVATRYSTNKVDKKDDCDSHESIVAGKRTSGDSCQLLIRNTWGSNFSDWTKDKKCLCRHKQTGEYLDDCDIKTHNNGQYTVEACWIDEALMKKNTFFMTTLE